ncbi:MAG: hypothetical protein WBR29_05685, partial [Gammaproteobacteria bacterium]
MESRYAPISRRRERTVRWLRSVPVLVLACGGLALGRPWLFGAAMMWGIASVVLHRLHARSLNTRLKALAAMLARDGDPSVAVRSLESIVADARALPGFHSIALLFLGIARARTGDVDGALDLLYVVHRAGWLDRRDVWQAWLLPWLSHLHGARGDLDLAEQWLDAARARLGGGQPDRTDRLASLVAPATLLALRRGDYDGAVARLDEAAGAAGETDPQREQRAVLRAFALEQA